MLVMYLDYLQQREELFMFLVGGLRGVNQSRIYKDAALSSRSLSTKVNVSYGKDYLHHSFGEKLILPVHVSHC